MQRPSLAAMSASLLVTAAAMAAVLAPTRAVAPVTPCTISPEFSGGAGTADEPYLLATRADLNRLSQQSSSCLLKHFKQTADIALTDPWTPIGSYGSGFRGTYDGGGHTITGLDVDTSTQSSWRGFFGQVSSGAVVQHLTVVGRITGDPGNTGYAGLVAGEVVQAELTDVHARGTVSGWYRLGGVAGWASEGALITKSSADVDVTGETAVGGLVGYLQGSTISQSHASGAVTATMSSSGRAGGLTSGGSLYGSDYAVIQNSYATGAVSGEATGTPVGTNGIGGIIGAAGDGRLRVLNSYATGLLTRTAGSGNGFGGVIGTDAVAAAGGGGITPMPSTFTGSAWNTDTVGALGALSGYGTALTSAQMRSIASFTTLGWGIVPTGTASGSNPWGICSAINNGFPYLQWEHPNATCPASADSPGTTVPTAVDPTVAAALSPPEFKRATVAPHTGQTRLVTRVQLGAAGAYTFIMLPTRRDVRLAQLAGSTVGRRTLERASSASTLTTRKANARIVLRTYFDAEALPLNNAAVRLLVIYRTATGALTSTLITTG